MKTGNKMNSKIITAAILSLSLISCNTFDETKDSKNSMFHLADKLTQKGDYKNALQFYEKAVREEPNNLDLRLKYATVLNLMKLYPDARRELRNILKIDNTLMGAKIELTKTYLNENKPKEALKLLNEIKASSELNSNCLVLLGTTHDMLGQHSLAQDNYRQAIKLDPTNNHIQSNLGLSLALSGQLSQGIKILEELNRLSTATAKDRHNLAVAYGMNKQYDKAKKLLATDLSPDNTDASLKFLKRIH